MIICLTFWKALWCFGWHTKGVSFFISCCRGSETWVMMGQNQVVDHSHKGLQLSKVLWGSCVGDGFNFEVVSSQSIRGPCKLKKDVWSTLNWNLWTVHYCPMLCQGHWVCADHALVGKSKIMEVFSIGTFLMGYWRCRVCCCHHQVLLARTHTPGVEDAKMGGTADFGYMYDIIYGFHIEGGALNCFVQVAGVQAKANCAIWLSCN